MNCTSVTKEGAASQYANFAAQKTMNERFFPATRLEGVYLCIFLDGLFKLCFYLRLSLAQDVFVDRFASLAEALQKAAVQGQSGPN